MGFEVLSRERLEPLSRILFKPYVAANSTVFMGVLGPFAAKGIVTNPQLLMLANTNN